MRLCYQNLDYKAITLDIILLFLASGIYFGGFIVTALVIDCRVSQFQKSPFDIPHSGFRLANLSLEKLLSHLFITDICGFIN